MVADYCTAAEIKAMMPDTSWGTGYDALLASLATRASRAIDRFSKREPGAYAAAEATRYFTSNGGIELDIGELAAPPTSVQIAETGVLTDLTDLAPTDYVLFPPNAIALGMPYNWLKLDLQNGSYMSFPSYRNAIVITGKFGYSVTPPEDVKQAVLIQAIRWFKRGQQAFKDTGAITELGQLTYTKALDPDVAEMLQFLRQVTI